jgi:hypothetical protein
MNSFELDQLALARQALEELKLWVLRATSEALQAIKALITEADRLLARR